MSSSSSLSSLTCSPTTITLKMLKNVDFQNMSCKELHYLILKTTVFICRSIRSIKGELIPYLVNKQFQKHKKPKDTDPEHVNTSVQESCDSKLGRS